MSGSAGGNRIPRTALQNTVNDYIKKVLKNFPGFKSAKISGSYNTTDKQDFGDIDLIVNIESGKDKKTDKQDLVKHLESLPTDVIVPFKSEKNKGKRTLNHGEIVTILYPITGVPNSYVQIDNIISSTEDESNFKKSILDYPAEKQGLILGLVKAVLLETDPNKVFAKMGITNLDPLEPNQEYEFHVSTAGLSLRKVTLDDNFKTLESTEMWSSSKFDDVKKLLSDYRIDGTFEELLQDVKKLKNPRSKNRVKGWFLKNIRVQAGEMGTPKAEKKQQAIDTVNALQEKYGKLALEIAKPFLLEDENTTIAVFPGKFKPPHKDHLARIQAASAAADNVLVIIGPNPVDSFTAEQSLSVFNLYKEKGLVPNNVKFIISDLPSPVLKAYKEFENNPNQQYIAVFGKDDIARFKNISKLPNVRVDNFEEANIGDLSATNLRNAIKSQNPTEIAKFLPAGISVEDYMNAMKMSLRTDNPPFSIKEEGSLVKKAKTPKGQFLKNWGIDMYSLELAKGLEEDTNTSNNMSFKDGIVSLTKYFVDQGHPVKPLPKLKIVSGDVENANKLLGRTAYYNPDEQLIALYVLGRHPKDILRSFSHELIHHMQNLRGDLNNNVHTTDTTQDEYLSKLEQEAYDKGNMIFRNWEDSIKNSKPINETYFLDTPKFNQPKTFVDKACKVLNEITLNPSNAAEIYGSLTNGKFQVGDVIYVYDIARVKNPYDDGGDFYNVMFHPKDNVTSIPQQGKENYIKILNTMYKIILDFTEEVEPEYIGISSLNNTGNKNYHRIYADLTDNKFNRIPGYFRKDVSLGFDTPEGKGRFVVLKRKDEVMNEQKETKYTIFCDMDGVLVDFDKGYEDLTDLHTKHVFLQNNDIFWDKFRQGLKKKGMSEYEYWAKLDWMSDGKDLWNYIKKYNPYILTAPSRNPESKEGKKTWTTRLDGMRNIYFRPAKEKADLSTKNRILIDDRADTIAMWNAKGGIGILHTSAADTIEQLKKLGL